MCFGNEKVTTAVTFYVNGVKVVEKTPQPEWTLLFYLRNKLRLTGTKLGCGEGGCGACTVMVSRYDRQKQNILHFAVNACLTPICALHGMAITTVEGVGNTRRLHAVQERLAKAHGSQCGFCTPGFVMSMYTLLRNTPVPSFPQVEESFQGNLCRCTGYRPILEGYKTFTTEFAEAGGCCGGKVNGVCCMATATQADDSESQSGNGYSVKESLATSLTPADFPSYDPTQEPIFPPELQVSGTYDSDYLVIEGEKITWYRPTTMEQLLELKASFPHAKLVVGNTEVALEMKFRQCDYPVIIHPTMIPEMVGITITDSGFVFGGSVTLSTLEHVLLEEIRDNPEHETRVYAAICEMLHWFAGKQIRNVAAIAGNIITSSPISDLNPLFMAAGCVLELRTTQGTRFVKMDHQFFTGYRKNIVRPDEILVSITIPKTKEDEYFVGFKQAKRRDDDISIVNAGCRVLFKPGTNVIDDIQLAFGGMAPTTVMAVKTMEALVGRTWDSTLVDDGCRLLLEDLPLPPSAPGGMAAYRQSLCLSFFFKFYAAVLTKLAQRGICSEDSSVISATTDIPRGEVKSAQLYELVPKGQPDYDPVGRPLPHAAALKHVTGEAIYCDDMPKLENELYMGLVMSAKSHARLVSVDPSAALLLPGVHAFLDAKDIEKQRNKWGPIVHDDEVFASEKVTCFGQIIGCVLADSQAIAQRAAKMVKVEYEELPAIVTIEDALKHKSFYDEHSRSIINGNVEEGFKMADHVLEDTFQMGGQEHFYLETQAAIVVPKEDDEMEIFCSTQNPTDIQFEVASILGIPANKIVCRVKRMGGGFGGKESRAGVVAFPAAVAAAKLRRPVRCMLDRDEDMILTGTRHPFRADYKVGFTKEGRITALEINIYANGGNSLDLSRGIIERALFHMDNSYNIPHVKAHAYVCKTNLPSNTAFRGFGGPQSMMICENWVNDIAAILDIDPNVVRSLNMYSEGDLTPFNQTLEYCTLRRCWEECQKMSSYQERQKKIDEFNRQNRYKKRGVAMIPTKFGISFTALFLNQAGALVHVYKDGSVLVTHGGTEMGQGLHIKMIQVASRALGIPPSRIHIAETSTDKVPNTSPTAASVGSDINGMAVLNACNAIVERLEPIRQANPKGKWDDWIVDAYFQRISLSATGFYKTPDIGYNFSTNTGKAFSYFTYGVACSEAEIDCLTGNHRVLRTDIVMDLGESLNPAIDIGQVEGGFVQGLGLFTLEEPLFSPGGVIMTRGPSNYKIPACDDIPSEFYVSLLRGCPNPRAVYSSKAVGEPPLFLAASAFFAIKKAISEARAEVGLKGKFQLNSPATAEKIRMACEDQFTNQVPKAAAGTFKPWAVSV